MDALRQYKAAVDGAIVRNSKITTVILAAMVVLMLALAFQVTKYKNLAAGMSKTGFAGWRRTRKREGMDNGSNVALSTAGPNPPTCAAGMTPTTIQNADGSLTTMCISGGPSVINDPTAILSACGQTWDPAATAEAQALATVGSYGHSGYGERKLQSAVDAAYDSNVGLTDDQLAQAMAGGAP